MSKTDFQIAVTGIMKEITDKEIIRKKLSDGRSSPLKTYVSLTAGETGIGRFILYELLTSILGLMPGGVGFYLRKLTYPWILGSVGSNVIIGRNVVLRHPKKIIIGNNVTIDDNCLLDGHGAGNEGLVLEDDVILNRNCILLSKAGPIRMGQRTSIGSNSVIVSMDGVSFGEAVLTAGSISVSTGLYHYGKKDLAVMDQGAYTKGPVTIGKYSWLGTGVIVLDGVSIGESVVIGAGSLVNKDIPDFSVAMGVPCKVTRSIDKEPGAINA